MFLLVCACVSGVAQAASSAPVTSEHDVATLVTDQESVSPGHPLGVGLRLQLKPGWHTYWLNPGDAGEAPTLKVTASGGASGESGPIAWPTPVRISEGGLMSYAYLGDTLLPEIVTPHTSGAGPVELKAHAEWLVCAQVCVPEQGDFTLTLPQGAGEASPEAGLFHKAASARPLPSPFAAAVSSDGVLSLSGAGISGASVKDAWFMPQDSAAIDQVASQPVSISGHTVSLKLAWAKGYHPGAPLSGIVVLKDAAGNESPLWVTAKFGTAGAPAGAAVPGFLRMLGFAFLGGLILNLMPCVFPVLAMKALALARMGGEGRAARLSSAAGYGLGVIATFVALGAGLLVLRAVGSGLGWGFQFQSPVFVLLVCWLVFLMALNLLGVFEVTTGSIGQDVAPPSGFVGDVLTGVLAVVVATPCTAPFMGVAIAGALAGPAWAAIVVFAGLGVGLAFPYLVLAGVPALARAMPRPGAWMAVLRQALAFPLLLTCVWLAWVMAQQAGPNGVLVALCGAVLLGGGAWAFGASQAAAMRDGPSGRWRGAAAAFVLAVIGVSVVGMPRLGAVAAATPSDGTQAFSESALSAARASGRPVFVDMTASWCITCMVNERVALDSAPVRAAFARGQVAYLKGDWTNRNETIGAFLRAHGRDGVPFYIYYPPHGEGQVLPQILTPSLVVQALGGAR